MPTSTSTSTIPVVDRDVETESLWRDLTAWFEAKAVPGEPVLNRVKLKYVEGSGRILCATEDIPVRPSSSFAPFRADSAA